MTATTDDQLLDAEEDARACLAAAAALESVERELAALLKRVAPAEARRDDFGLF